MASSDIRAGRAWVELGVRNNMAAGMAKALNAAKAQLQNFGSAMATVGAGLLKIGSAAALPFGLSVATFANFDDAMRMVKAVTQSTDEEFRKLTETAKQLGASTSFTAGQVAAMMTELGRAGFSAAQIDVMTASVLNLSRATGTDSALASGIMAASIRQFGLEAGDAARVADVLTQAANSTFNTVEGLGEAMKYAGPVAKSLGLSFEETAAILGVLGNVGIQGSAAGTALRRLGVISAASGEELKKLFNISNVDAAGNLKPLVEILDEIGQVTANMPVAERTAKMAEAFGLLGITSAGVLSQAAGGVRKLTDELKNSDGVAAKTAKEMDGGLGGAFRIMMSAIEGVSIAIGEALGPTLTTIMANVTSAAGIVTKFIQENQGLIVIIAEVAAGVIAAGAAFLAIGTSLMAAGAVLGAISAGITFFSGLIGGAITIVGGLIGIVAALIPELSLTNLGFAAVGAAIYAWLRYTESGAATMTTLGGVVATVAGQIREAFDAIVATVMPFVDVFQKAISGISDALASGDIGTAAQIAMTSVTLAFEMAKELIIEAWISVRETMIGLWEGVVDYMIGAWQLVVRETSAALAFIGSLASSVFGELTALDLGTALSVGWNTFKLAAQAAFDYVLTATSLLLEAFKMIRAQFAGMAQDIAVASTGQYGAGAIAAAKAIKESDVAVGAGSFIERANQAAQQARERVGGDQEAGNRDRQLQRDGNKQERDSADEEWRQAQQERIKGLRDERDKLNELARKKREELDQKKEEDKKKGGPLAGGVDAAGVKEVIEGKNPVATFSAAAAIAMGRGGGGGNPQERAAKAAEANVKVADDIRAFVGKNNQLMKKSQEILDDIARNTKNGGLA